MAQANRISNAVPQDRFVPGDVPEHEHDLREKPEHWTGTRKVQVISTRKYGLRWPKDRKARNDLFRAWHSTAMQETCSKAGPALYVLAAIWPYWNDKNGLAWPSNKLLAQVSGKTEKTISRGVSNLSRAGFFDCKYQYFKDANGNKQRRRTISFTIPDTFKNKIFLTNLDDDYMDSSGPCEPANDVDHVCPIYIDSSGPDTDEYTVERGEADAA